MPLIKIVAQVACATGHMAPACPRHACLATRLPQTCLLSHPPAPNMLQPKQVQLGPLAGIGSHTPVSGQPSPTKTRKCFVDVPKDGKHGTVLRISALRLPRILRNTLIMHADGWPANERALIERTAMAGEPWTSPSSAPPKQQAESLTLADYAKT